VGRSNKRRSIITVLIVGAVIVVLGLAVEFVVYRYQVNRSALFRTDGNRIQIYRDKKWRTFLVKGVNLGAGKPGFGPDATGTTKEDYSRWLKQIAAMNVNVIRVYTILPPDFYRAFFEFNMLAPRPIFLLQGVRVPESDIAKYQNAYENQLSTDFFDEIRRTIDVIHGKASFKYKGGTGSASYSMNISPYVMGYIISQEMNPDFVIGTNTKNTQVMGFEGDYLFTDKASPYEAWLAGVGNYAVSYEQKNYGGPFRLISWINWPTTDPLVHLNEPDQKGQDAVGVNLEHIHTTEKFRSGIFASYQIFPFYPDFIKYQPEYAKYVDAKGRLNPYEAYLAELKAFHTMPVLVTEFGIPASRGMSGTNPLLKLTQGCITEKTQGQALADMFDSIVNAGLAGGLVYSWQDDWSQKTWNTGAFDIAGRRPYWHNYLSSGESYGILGFEGGLKAPFCQVDGDISEWKGKTPIYNSDGIELYAANDERFVYLMLRDQKGSVEKDTYYIGSDVVPALGSTTYTDGGITFSRPVDVIISVNGRDNSSVLIEASEDMYYRYYSLLDGFFPRQSGFELKNSGIFNPWQLMVTRPLLLPQTNQRIPLEAYNAGKLLHGNSNPASPDYTNLADFYISLQNKAIEMRIPWMLFNALDPSTRTFAGDLYTGKTFSLNPVKVEGIYFEPRRAGSRVSAGPGLFTWNAWADAPETHERLKESYAILQKKFAEQ